MSRVNRAAQSDFIWRGENFSDVQTDLDFPAGIQIERDGQFNGDQFGICGEVK